MNGHSNNGEIVLDMHDQNESDAQLKRTQDNIEPVFKELKSLVSFLAKNTDARRDIPIVLVPGFSGWGAPILNSFNYFGGFADLIGQITDMGWNVILPSIGPFSSNWERACELYSQLTDQPNVDYGAAFTASSPHEAIRQRFSKVKRECSYRRPKPAPGVWVMPEDWTWNDGNQVHFICHSQGGNTARYLIELLRTGNQPGSYFMTPGRDAWCRSVVTLATPHNGSTVIDILNESGPNVERLLQEMVCATSYTSPQQRAYDVQLDHWGIQRNGNEDFPAMLARLTAINPPGPYTLWRNSVKNGFYDNSIEGVAKLNQMIPAPSPLVYYFTMSFSATVPTTTFKVTTKDIQTLIPAAIPVLRWIPFLFLYTYPFSFVVALIGNRIGSFASILNWAVTRVNARLPVDAIIPALFSPGTQLPRWDILVLFAPTAYGMGGWTLTRAQRSVLGSLGMSPEGWQENDGIVNTLSMRGPIGGKNKCHEMQTPKIPETGLFNHLGLHRGFDHADVLGINLDPKTVAHVESLYRSLAELLSYLP